MAVTLTKVHTADPREVQAHVIEHELLDTCTRSRVMYVGSLAGCHTWLRDLQHQARCDYTRGSGHHLVVLSPTHQFARVVDMRPDGDTAAMVIIALGTPAHP